MNDRELLYLKTIAETKSISKAAKKLFISQPSLSQSLLKIEEDIGTILFQRNRHGMVMTYVGEQYVETATKILNMYDDFINEVTYVDDLKKGRVTFGITSFMAKILLPKLLPKFKKNYPNIEIFIKEESSNNLENLILNGSIDFAIMHSHPLIEQKQIEYDHLYEDYFILATPKNHVLSQFKQDSNDFAYPKISLDLFADEEFIFVNRKNRIRHITDIIMNTVGMNPNVALTFNNFDTARRLVSEEIGVMLLPSLYGKIFDEEYPADYYILDDIKYAFWNSTIATNPNMYLSKIAKVFIDLVHEYYETEEQLL